MKKLKNLLLALLSVTCIGAAAVGFAGCNGSEETSSSANSSVNISVDSSISAYSSSASSSTASSIENSSSSDSSSVEEKKEPSEGLEFTLNTDEISYSVAGIGTCKDTDIVIPATYEGLPVTTIGNFAFNSCSSLTSVVIPDSVTTIGNYAFSHCSSLTSVVIPDSVTTIGNTAFWVCSDLTSVVIPDSVTTIGYFAFACCDNLMGITVDENNTAYKSIDGNLYTKDGTTLIQYAIGKTATEFVIPDGVTTIGEPAFYDCSSLTSIEIPDSVTTIDYRAFYNCDSLTSIEIPDSVTTIGGEAFYKCSSLTSIAVDENNTKYKSIDGNLYTKDGTTLIQYAIGKTATEFVIPDGVTTISEQAFYNCDSLTSVEIGNSVTTIGASAFENCSSLTSVVIGDGVTTIGNRAFFNCGLTSIEIPDSVTTIGYGAFEYCYSLTIYCEVASQPSGWSANWNYYSCPIVWDCNNNDVATDGYIYTVIDGVRYAIKDGKAMLVSQPSNVTTANILESITYKEMEYSVTAISNGVFRNCSSLASITVDENNGAYKSIDGNLYTKDGITLIQYAIGKTATEFIIPDSVTMIDRWAFFNCGSLTSVVIPDSVIVIGYSAFEGCTNLTSIEIPDSVIMIGYSAFEGCTNLTSITFEGTIEEWNAISKGMYWKSNVPATEVVCKDGSVAL